MVDRLIFSVPSYVDMYADDEYNVAYMPISIARTVSDAFLRDLPNFVEQVSKVSCNTTLYVVHTTSTAVDCHDSRITRAARPFAP